MDNDDFTFCQVGVPADNEPLEIKQAVPNIGDIRINEDSTNDAGNNQVDSLARKDQLSDKSSSKKQERVGSLSFSVIDMSAPKRSNELSKPIISARANDSVEGLQNQRQMTAAKVPKVRAKVPFEKGHSQVDWLKLTQTHPDLAGLKGESNRRLISIDEVKQHQKEDPIWTVLKGRVYNLSPYMKFHPGGVDMLRKGAGKDCTSLFNKYHAWVNAEFLLEKCLVGILDESR